MDAVVERLEEIGDIAREIAGHVRPIADIEKRLSTMETVIVDIYKEMPRS